MLYLARSFKMNFCNRVNSSIACPDGAKGPLFQRVGRLGKGMSAVISRVYYSGDEAHNLGVITHQINDFPGVKEGDTLFLGGGFYSRPIVSLTQTLDSPLFKVFHCETASGSRYEVIATPRRNS
jgi:hypothetical protein